MSGELERKLKGLLRGEFSSLSISFNEHSSNYIDAAEAASHTMFYVDDYWASDEEKRRAIEANSIWAVQWYPVTPVGFCRVLASSLDAAIKAALETKDR